MLSGFIGCELKGGLRPDLNIVAPIVIISFICQSQKLLPQIIAQHQKVNGFSTFLDHESTVVPISDITF